MGSHLQYDSEIVELVLKTSLAGISAGLAAALASVLGGGMKTLGSVLSGFVAISAACDVVRPAEAIIIGGVAGLLYPLACALLIYTVLSGSGQGKTIGVIAAPGVCGVWGTLCVALFGTEGLLSAPDKGQLMIQLKGVVVAFGFSVITAYVCLSIYRVFSGLLGDRNHHQEKQKAPA